MEVSPDKSLRVPRILPLEKTTTESNREIFKIAAQVLYRLWWEDKESSTEEQALEIHRLALLGRETEIAAEFANVLGNRWKKSKSISGSSETLQINFRYYRRLSRFTFLSTLGSTIR